MVQHGKLIDPKPKYQVSPDGFWHLHGRPRLQRLWPGGSSARVGTRGPGTPDSAYGMDDTLSGRAGRVSVRMKGFWLLVIHLSEM